MAERSVQTGSAGAIGFAASTFATTGSLTFLVFGFAGATCVVSALAGADSLAVPFSACFPLLLSVIGVAAELFAGNSSSVQLPPLRVVPVLAPVSATGFCAPVPAVF